MSEDPDSRSTGDQSESDTQAMRGGFNEASARTFRQAALWILGYSLLVIIFGAFVRASLSGDGCGVHWPDCYGSILPKGAPLQTYIELTHRTTSGFLIILSAALAIASFRLFPKGSLHRKAGLLTLVSVLISAAIGAALVLNKWVEFDRSAARAITMPLHLVNNYFLIGTLLLLALPAEIVNKIRFRKQGEVGGLVWGSLTAMFVLGGTGALSAMGKTAFSNELATAQGLSDRLQLHMAADAHPLLKGGISHPLIATGAFILILLTCRQLVRRRPSEQVSFWSNMTSGSMVFQMLLGLVNLIASAPVALQLFHLAAAVFTFGSFSMMSFHAFATAEKEETVGGGTDESSEPLKQEAVSVKPNEGFMAIVKDYIALTKPRVISLLLFTTVLAMIIANGAWPPLWQMILVAIGGYMAAGAANTLNMIVERDLDVAMERTASRPTVTQRITNGNALIFAIAMAVGSCAILTLSSNALSALLAMAGLVFYVLIYTLLLKRRTWQNIVIGGAAGAFPPLVGYAAVRGELSVFAWILFGIIFFWTPVHFWALAILIKDDYAKAGVPMLPVVKGERVTVIQIVLYAVLTAVISIIPLFMGEAGILYLAGAVVLNIVLLVQSLQLMRNTSAPRARALFKYSMLYLALLFIVIAVDRSWVIG